MSYTLFSYGDAAAPRRDQRSHDRYTDRVEAEEECRRLVMDEGRRSAHVMRNIDGEIVYPFDHVEAATCAAAADGSTPPRTG